MDIWQIAYKLTFTLRSYVTTVNLKKMNCHMNSYTKLVYYFTQLLTVQAVEEQCAQIQVAATNATDILNCYPMHTTYYTLHF